MSDVPPDPVHAAASGAPRRQRADGHEARERLLHAALRLFAEQGYARTSIREIAQAAGANVAAVSYYFGDKQGLYRAAFIEPMGSPRDDIALFSDPSQTLPDALRGLFSGFLEPFSQGELARLCTRLHMREMIEPTGAWAEEIDNGIQPYTAALTDLLARHFGLSEADDDLYRLAFSIVSLGVFLFTGRDVVQAIRPQLMSDPQALDVWGQRLVTSALAMIDAEAHRRGLPRPSTSVPPAS